MMAKGLKWYSFRWRVGAFLLVPIVLVFGYIDYRFYLASRVLPMGEGPAGPDVPAETFQKIWSDVKVVLLGVGDSITEGYGADSEHNYFALLQQNDDSMCPDMNGKNLRSVLPRLEVKNFAVSCSVSSEHLNEQLPKIPTWPKDVKGIIVVTSGGNDLIHSYGFSPPRDGAMYGCTYQQAIVWTENVKQRIDMLLQGLMGKFDGGCEIFLANIYDPTDGLGDPQIVGFKRWPDAVRVLSLMNEKIAELCEKYDNVHLVDIHSEFLGHGIHCTEPWRKYYHIDDPHYWYDANLEDPNPRGYDAIRRLFLLEMVKVLPEKFTKERNSIVIKN